MSMSGRVEDMVVASGRLDCQDLGMDPSCAEDFHKYTDLYFARQIDCFNIFLFMHASRMLKARNIPDACANACFVNDLHMDSCHRVGPLDESWMMYCSGSSCVQWFSLGR